MNNFRVFLVFFTNMFLINNILAKDKNNNCVTKQTCGECIQESQCVWCSKPILPSNVSDPTLFVRCIDIPSIKTDWCSDEYQINPQPFEQLYILDQPFHSSNTHETIQIRPQKVHLKLRRGAEYKLHFSYAQAEDYPVDLYYLMDLSASMADDRDNLSKLGDRLADAMKNITRNFRLGFGSFVDKTDMPFVSIVPEKMERPCVLSKTGEECGPPYSFHNHLPLTENTALFTKEVRKARVSGNLDSPEGGFDAILQAIVCQKEIGWREKARHLLVFSTDAGFHLAGDGKLAGIVKPHDGNCYLDQNGFYTHALKFDYPSISFINRYVKRHNINLIFAVVANQANTYRELKQNINGAEFGILDERSSNVVDLVRRVYDKLVDSVTITDNAGSLIEIKYFSKCSDESEEKETRECGGVRYGKKIDFTAVIKVSECPKNRSKWHHTFEIKPRSINESLTVDIDVVCDCACEKNGQIGFEQNSITCNSAGDLKCGICSCTPGHFGRYCECDGFSGTTGINFEGCKATKETKDVCSGHGSCRCGKCECHKRQNNLEYYYGTYCECNNFSCKRHGGVLCSGHGTCDCGVCICNPDWSGSACECRNTIATCIQQEGKDICSGKGVCECGACRCQTEPNHYSGKYCEECPDCLGQRCEELKDCVECQAFNNSGKYDFDDCVKQCTAFNTILVDKINDYTYENGIEELADGDVSKICEQSDDSGCTIKFMYKYDSNNRIHKVYAQKEKKCPTQIDLIAVIFGVIGSIVLAGIILLLIWKLLTEIHDRREYERFERERNLAKWHRSDNPLYKASTSTFNNPLYGQMN